MRNKKSLKMISLKNLKTIKLCNAGAGIQASLRLNNNPLSLRGGAAHAQWLPVIENNYDLSLRGAADFGKADRTNVRERRPHEQSNEVEFLRSKNETEFKLYELPIIQEAHSIGYHCDDISFPCHCEERSDEAIQKNQTISATDLDCHAAPAAPLAMTCSEKSKAAFTLAETLITLMVIGVVAALTIPSLMTAYKDKQLDTAKKKAKAILGNGYKKMMVEEETEFSDLPIFKCGTDFSCLSEVHRKIFTIGTEKSKSKDGLPEKYSKSDSEDEADFKWEDVPYIFTTTDGMTYGFMADEESGTIDVVVDVNGNKAPNKICQDVEKFKIASSGKVISSEKKSDGTVSGACTELNTIASNSCSAENIAKCKTEEDFANLYSIATATGDSEAVSHGIRRIVLSDGSCLLIGQKSQCVYWWGETGQYDTANCNKMGSYIYGIESANNIYCK